MLTTVDGLLYVSFLENGIKNVVKNKKALNALNVFPVPDGDTGTNMVMTLRYGYEGITKSSDDISSVAGQFSQSAVFGARGNSGVIVSQFFKGLAEGFQGKTAVNCEEFLAALECGYQYAYRAVVKPVEGTMLTVLREAAEEAKVKAPFDSIEQLLDVYLQAARASLDKTPTLLPVLKKAGVVDSGGSGVVCFFEGVQKYLNGETVEAEEEIAVAENIDLTRFNKDTNFVYGYCIEGLLQLKMDASDFNQSALRDNLTTLGNSIVMSLEGGKLKLHIHSKKPGNVFNCCQEYGEFLTIKIENMTLQHIQQESVEEPVQKIMHADADTEFDFAVVAVAPNAYLQKKLFEMGADIVIMSEIAPSAQEFIDAFQCTNAKEILVFPNSSNSILTAMHAGSLYQKSRVMVLNSRSVEECYLTLGLIEFEDGIYTAIDTLNAAISNLHKVFIYHADRDIQYGKHQVSKNDFFALSDKTILETGESVADVTVKTIEKVLQKTECSILTIFYGIEIAEEFIEALAESLRKRYSDLEIGVVATHETVSNLALVFER